ncbi:MAG: transporter substrate-binding domain-containing protein [Desulfarculaceae bacterium]|nr:transporter substrate-binding domain-containing protein [Desulfarculaceae bacterium]MCF8072504.1 transporter substrate-binding domain-containing protein [Desulfarculaceae bacterium]MCF8103645.1 transporter substrate-binding domain-containing protein [Desulfarculaceae bacterium]MCF8117045.1 transporter substrate-binding domain-containing protein [Desulfarculaceae bacterium]
MAAKRTILAFLLIILLAPTLPAAAGDLDQLRGRGELRHLGVPYANFITGTGDGLTVEVLKLFAKHLGVRYRFVPTTWENGPGDLLGLKVSLENGQAVLGGPVPVKGDVWAGGVTVLPWRQDILTFSRPTFPNQVWLVARAQSKLEPIKPSGDPARDVAAVKAQIAQVRILCVAGTCLDGREYQLDQQGADLHYFSRKVSEIVPAVIKGEAEATLQDAPDAVISLAKWPGELKIIGPVSPSQIMAAAFAPSSPELLAEFDRFMGGLKKRGEYRRLVRKYFPAILHYFPQFFAQGD